ncbi:MAG: branched-chain amino acid ABC transporter permease, partial [Lachnospiraceae bacterium]|nr:branched-chain amino acid ABC transporter permease [Lachnospiraceae bacterium]
PTSGSDPSVRKNTGQIMYIQQVLINEILLGGVYAILGLGMSLSLGIVRLTNLAHGEYIILGAYASMLIQELLGADPFLSLIISIPVLFLAGFLIQGVLVNRAMTHGGEPALLVTFGISVILKDVMLLVFGADARHISAGYSNLTVTAAGLSIPLLNILLLALSGVSVLFLHLFMKHTYMGRAIRAVADDPEAAALSGIGVSRTLAVASGTAAATAAVAGLCAGMKWTWYPSSGGNYLLIAFVIVVIGGLENIAGTFAAGIAFGLMQAIGGASYGMLISYIFLIIIMTLDPHGALRRHIDALRLKKPEAGPDDKEPER